MNSGERLGKALFTGTSERYVCEWLSAQAAPATSNTMPLPENSSMEPEQALALAVEDSPVFLGAVGDNARGGVSRRAKGFRGLQDRQGYRLEPAHECLFCGTRALFPHRLLKHHLVQEWLPALAGVVAKLTVWRQGRRYRVPAMAYRRG